MVFYRKKKILFIILVVNILIKMINFDARERPSTVEINCALILSK